MEKKTNVDKSTMKKSTSRGREKEKARGRAAKKRRPVQTSLCQKRGARRRMYNLIIQLMLPMMLSPVASQK
jgi:hypothetical protein